LIFLNLRASTSSKTYVESCVLACINATGNDLKLFVKRFLSFAAVLMGNEKMKEEEK
jgi:hypothetical protein